MTKTVNDGSLIKIITKCQQQTRKLNLMNLFLQPKHCKTIFLKQFNYRKPGWHKEFNNFIETSKILNAIMWLKACYHQLSSRRRIKSMKDFPYKNLFALECNRFGMFWKTKYCDQHGRAKWRIKNLFNDLEISSPSSKNRLSNFAEKKCHRS